MGEKDEVLEAGVEMGLLFEADNLLEVGVVNVCINPKQSLENSLHDVPEVHGKWSPYNAKQRVTC
jgi:hypothetical protein